MFHMMNEARIGVGLGAAALGYTGYLHALDYARKRPQGRRRRRQGPGAPQVPIIEHADVRRMLLAQKAYVEGGLALSLYCARLVDDAERPAADEAARARPRLLLDLLTPVAKSWPSQWCLEANDLAIQVHGGYGYTRDYNVEQFYRDNRLNPIHEGTHGIQALDLLGRKVRAQGGAALGAGGERAWRRPRERAGAMPALAAQAGEACAQRGPASTEVTARAAGRRRSERCAGQRHALPRGLRPRRRRLAVAGAGLRRRRGAARGGRRGRGLLPGQDAGRDVLHELGAAPHRGLARRARPRGRHLPRNAAVVVLSRGAAQASPVSTPSRRYRTRRGRSSIGAEHCGPWQT